MTLDDVPINARFAVRGEPALAYTMYPDRSVGALGAGFGLSMAPLEAREAFRGLDLRIVSGTSPQPAGVDGTGSGGAA